jgi:guanylate cyclase
VSIGKRYENVAVLFCELQVPAGEALPTLMDLNTLFGLMDGVVDTVPDAFKIETVGGQLVVAAGVPAESKDAAGSMLLLATRIRAALRAAKWSTGEQVEMRIGMHTGPIGKDTARKKK